MRRIAAAPRGWPSWLLPALAALFFLSGISGLIYQSLWQRLLSLIFGVTVYATATVLASFMAGLALGSLLAGRVADRIRHPLAAFGLVELAIGAVSLATPFLLPLALGSYVYMRDVVPDSLALSTVVRFICSFLILLAPTVLMGATLPLVVKSAVGRHHALGPRVGLLYATNTAGAIAGALAAGFVLIGGVGIRGAFLCAAILNTVVGFSALALSRAVRPLTSETDDITAPPDQAGPPHAPQTAATSETTTEPRESPIRTGAATWMPVLFGLSGLASLGLEVVWFRLLVLFVPATTYAFSSMLAAVLIGIAAGSALAARLLRRERNWTSTFAVLQIATGAAAVAGMRLLFALYARGPLPDTVEMLALVGIVPAACLMGLNFPIGVRLFAGREGSREDTGWRIGRLYAANVAGAILGPVLAGFLVLPAVGSRGSLVAFAAVFVMSGLAVLLLDGARTAGAAAVSFRRAPSRATLLLALLLTGTFIVTAPMPDPMVIVQGRRLPPGERMFWKEEGMQTTVGVYVRPMGGRVLYLDGLHQANDSWPMVRLHRQIGLLPMALHADPRRALVVGLGGGVTPGAVSQFDRAQVEIVELSPSVVRAAPWFADVNFDVLRRPNVRLRVDDGRQFLLFNRGRYDVLTADLIQPYHAGAGTLYSREYFALARAALARGGLMMQWNGGRTKTEFALILRTFLDVFPDTTAWVGGSLMIGSVGPLRISRSAFERHLTDPPARLALETVGMGTLDELLGLFTAGPDRLRAFTGDGPILTDDRPLVEYHRSLPRDEAPPDLRAVPEEVRRFVVP